VNGSRERDQSIDRLLRQSLRPPQEAIADSCLDAETLAAWMDGGLSGAALAVAQSHVADCTRCQALVGVLARTVAMVPAPEPARRRWLVWLVPLTAASAAVALWFVVPRSGSEPALSIEAIRTPAAEGKAPEPGSADKEATANRLEPQQREAQLQKDGDALKSAPAAAPPSTLAARQEVNARPLDAIVGRAAARIEIVSPDVQARWRLAGPVVEQSTDGGSTWDAVFTLAGAELTAGAAPSASTCWVIGRRGVVLRSTDGRTFALVTFPAMTDLSAVMATDARSASVSTVDGRTFSTTDGGATWRLQ